MHCVVCCAALAQLQQWGTAHGAPKKVKATSPLPRLVQGQRDSPHWAACATHSIQAGACADCHTPMWAHRNCSSCSRRLRRVLHPTQAPCHDCTLSSPCRRVAALRHSLPHAGGRRSCCCGCCRSRRLLSHALHDCGHGTTTSTAAAAGVAVQRQGHLEQVLTWLRHLGGLVKQLLLGFVHAARQQAAKANTVPASAHSTNEEPNNDRKATSVSCSQPKTCNLE